MPDQSLSRSYMLVFPNTNGFSLLDYIHPVTLSGGANKELDAQARAWASSEYAHVLTTQPHAPPPELWEVQLFCDPENRQPGKVAEITIAPSRMVEDVVALV